MQYTVLHLLENTYRKLKDNIALADETRQFSYQELRRNALKIANYIAEWNTTKQAVIVLSERDVRCIVMFWGVLYSGNFYVPLNYKNNKGVFGELLKEIHPVGILCCEENKEAEELCRTLNINYGCFEKMLFGQTEYDWQRNPHILESDPAYMVFTSGSTGIPKGIIKSHHSIVSFVKSFLEVFPLHQEDIFGNQAEFDYDVAAKDLYLTVAVGAKLAVIPKKCFLMPAILMQYLQEWKINTLIWAAAAVRLVAKSGCLEKYHDKLNIKTLFFSGEELAREEIGIWVRFLPEVLYVNLYAPSEVTGNCLYYKVEKENIPAKLPLGVPFENIDILLLDETLKPVGENELGEIFVRGPFMSMGYYGDMKQTSEKFIQNPLHKEYMDIVYRTGDLAKYIDGSLYFQGRKDYQIKFMGHRIELFEVESVFQQASNVKRCCCVLLDSALVMFYSEPVEINTVVKRMKEIIPKYKIPQKFVQIDDFPENARGKLDRQKLIEKYKELQSEQS